MYAGFEGGMSISLRNLEHARCKFLLEKLTGKLPDTRSGMAQTLPPLKESNSSSKHKRRPSAVSGSSKSGLDDSTALQATKTKGGMKKVDFETKDGEGAGEALAKGEKNAKWSDLDKYIELLLDNKSEEETVFVYLNQNTNGDPYDLLVCSYADRNSRCYTLSGKGLTYFENDNPIEFISLGQWLIERDSYNHIKDLPFFKKFKRWKFMRMWKKTIKRQNRMKAQNALEENLFISVGPLL